MTKLDAQKNKEDKQRNLGSKRFHKYLPLQIANSSNEVKRQKSDPPTNHHCFGEYKQTVYFIHAY